MLMVMYRYKVTDFSQKIWLYVFGSQARAFPRKLVFSSTRQKGKHCSKNKYHFYK